MDTTSYKTARDDPKLNLSDIDIGDTILLFCANQLTIQHSRPDYAEFLKLVIIFLGGIPPSGISFRAPGAYHHARWMAKAIYCLKIYMFRDKFHLTAREINGIRDICQFVVRLYVNVWFLAPVAAAAPNLDLKFLLDLHSYSRIDKDISNVTVKKMCGHLWYLSEEAVGLAFFDKSVPLNIKEKMVQAINGTDPNKDDYCHYRNVIQPKDVRSVAGKTLDHFVSTKTISFFKRFNISTDFLQFEPSIWLQCQDYIAGLEIVNKIVVVNDVSERKVKLMEEFNTILTNDEDQKQFLLLTVEEYHKKYPTFNKNSLIGNI